MGDVVFSMIGILSIIMCVVCMFVHIIIDKALKKQIQSRLIAAVLFFMTIMLYYLIVSEKPSKSLFLLHIKIHYPSTNKS